MSTAVNAAYEAYNPTGAAVGKVRALAVTSTTSNVDVLTLAEVGADVGFGRMLRLRADGADVYYAFGNAAQALDDTNTTAGNAGQCDVIPNGQYVDVRPPYVHQNPVAGGSVILQQLYSTLNVKTRTGTTATLRVSVVSEAIENKNS